VEAADGRGAQGRHEVSGVTGEGAAELLSNRPDQIRVGCKRRLVAGHRHANEIAGGLEFLDQAF